MGTFLVLDIPKVPSDSTIWELRKSIFGIFGIKNLSRLDSRDMWLWVGRNTTKNVQISVQNSPKKGVFSSLSSNFTFSEFWLILAFLTSMLIYAHNLI